MKNRKFCSIEQANWCALTANSNSISNNQFVKKVIKEFKAASPETFRPCPIKGLLVFNLTASSLKTMIDMMPVGLFIFKASVNTMMNQQRVGLNFSANFILTN